MSGGVDSSVAAALLVAQGYQVSGAFMKNWSDCQWQKDRRDATRVAAKLNIPFTTFDFERAYRDRVVEYLFREYAGNRTPNPDVMCNKEIKFKLFLEKALSLGFDYIATGHYARVKEVNGVFELWQSVDKNKDQSYFLNALGQTELKHALFPIGDYHKTEVREMARRYQLPTADKPDSQGICFIGEINLKEFLKSRLPVKAGAVVTTEGDKIGEHEGVWFYTIGQRHGFANPGGGVPYYVVEKQDKTNTLVVSHGETKALYRHSLLFNEPRWVGGYAPALPWRGQAKIRYRQPSQAVTIRASTEAGQLEAVFDHPQRAVTPGQFIVLYLGEQLVGGGVIV